MAVVPFSAATVLSTQSLNASPDRYSLLDAAKKIRTVSLIAFFVPWELETNRYVRVIGHDQNTAGRDAQTYEQTSALTSITASNPYEAAVVGGAGDPTQDIEIVQFIAQYDGRDAAQVLLSDDYNQREFQKRAMEFAIFKTWEQMFILGNPSVTAGQPRGLAKLTTDGLGRSIAAANPTNPMLDLDIGWAAVKAHNGRCDLIIMNEGAIRYTLNEMRTNGVTPDWRTDPRVPGYQILHWNGTPICRSDYIVESEGETTVYFMTLGRPNGVYAAVPNRAPGIVYKSMHREDSPYETMQASLYSAPVSPTSDALIALTSYPAYTAV